MSFLSVFKDYDPSSFPFGYRSHLKFFLLASAFITQGVLCLRAIFPTSSGGIPLSLIYVPFQLPHLLPFTFLDGFSKSFRFAGETGEIFKVPGSLAACPEELEASL